MWKYSCTVMCCHVLVCTSMYLYIPFCKILSRWTGFQTMVYPWIYRVYPSQPSIYMVNPWMYMYISIDIHGISFDVYTWYICGIFMDIPSFMKPDFAACACCWSHSMSTLVMVIKITLLHSSPWPLCQGKRQTTKGSTRLPPTPPPAVTAAAVTAEAAEVLLTSFCFPSLVAGNNLNHGELERRG